MKSIKINIAKTAGFCFGVKRAIKIALEAAKSGSIIEMLGDVVHNEEIVRDMQDAGIRKVLCLTRGKNKKFLIRAHGVPLKTIIDAKRCGYKIIDATCPMVKEIHKIAISMEKNGRKIIIIGDRSHSEVQGIIGHLKTVPLVIESAKYIPIAKIDRIKRAGVLVQSTQNIEKVYEILNSLKEHIKDLKFFNTICSTTRAKQNEVKIMPLKNDIMIIIGSKTSANTKRLYEISKSLNERSYWVQTKKDLRKSWFTSAKSVGIHAGASTPDYTTRGVINHIKEITVSSCL